MISHSPDETKALGRRLAAALAGGENLLLVGELGSGKTAFVQGLAEGFGVTEAIKSPTFTYLREYPLPRRSTRLAHFDLYRLPDRPSPRDLQSIELLERLEDADTIAVVEWADKLPRRARRDQYVIEFAVTGDDRREIRLPEGLRRGLPA